MRQEGASCYSIRRTAYLYSTRTVTISMFEPSTHNQLPSERWFRPLLPYSKLESPEDIATNSLKDALRAYGPPASFDSQLIFTSA